MARSPQPARWRARPQTWDSSCSTRPASSAISRRNTVPPTVSWRPKLQIYSSQTAANRVNTVNSAVYGGQLDIGTKFDLSAFVTAAANATTLVNLINEVFFHEAMSNELRSAINQALAPLTAPADKARAALYVALTSAEYQIIH